MAEEKIEAEIVDEEPHEFDIIPVQDEQTKVFSIRNYDELYSRISKWVSENSPKGKIDSQEAFDHYLKDKPKVLKEGDSFSLRVVAANLKELVSTVRKGIVKSTMGTFEEQAKSIETLLDTFDKECKEEKAAWLKATTNKVAKPTALSLTIKSYDAKVIDKVKAYAIKLGCEVK